MDDAIGPFCKDVDGNVLLDMTAHVGANTLGYNNPKMQDKIEELFEPFSPTKIAGQDFYIGSGKTPSDSKLPNPSELMDRLTDISSHYNMGTVFLSNTGAEAVENAIKICYHNTNGKYGITFDGAFHGRTLGTLSLNRSKGMYREHFPEISSIESVPFCRDQSCSKDTCSCGFFTRDHESMLDRLVGEKNGQMNPDEISYIILEPIQGEGGYYMPSDEFMDEISRIAEKYDIHIISDEVQAGIGRTGEWWGIDNYSLEPDVISAAKPVQVGATIGKDEVFPDKDGRLSSTWGAGDLVATAQGVATIDVIQENNLMDNAVDMGNLFNDLFDADEFDTVSDVRQKGLMIGIEFTSKKSRSKVVSKALEKGLLLLACGNKTIRILPPLDVSEREIRMVNSILSECIE
jgi:4-aminobutyrate aminotransferase